MTQIYRRKQLFLIELWREPSFNGEAGSWRGIAKHLAHDEQHYITNFTDIASFISSRIAAIARRDSGVVAVGQNSDASLLGWDIAPQELEDNS